MEDILNPNSRRIHVLLGQILESDTGDQVILTAKALRETGTLRKNTTNVKLLLMAYALSYAPIHFPYLTEETTAGKHNPGSGEVSVLNADEDPFGEIGIKLILAHEEGHKFSVRTVPAIDDPAVLLALGNGRSGLIAAGSYTPQLASPRIARTY